MTRRLPYRIEHRVTRDLLRGQKHRGVVYGCGRIERRTAETGHEPTRSDLTTGVIGHTRGEVHGDRIGTLRSLRPSHDRSEVIEHVLPRHVRTVELRRIEAINTVMQLRQRTSLGTRITARYRMVRVAADAHDSIALDIDKHTARRRTDTAERTNLHCALPRRRTNSDSSRH